MVFCLSLRNLASGSGAVLLAGLFGLTACGGGGGGGNSAASSPAPVVNGFVAAKSPITKGTGTSLTATFLNGNGQVNNGVGAVSSGVPVTVVPGQDTTYTLTVTNGAGINATASREVLVVAAATQPVITGTTSVTAGVSGYVASVPDQVGCTFLWTIENGTITAGQGTSRISYTAGSVDRPLSLSCKAMNAAGDGSAAGTVNANVVPAAGLPVISGPSFTTAGKAGYIASTPAQEGCTYLWTITNGVITNGLGTNSVVFTAGVVGDPLALQCKVVDAAGGESSVGSFASTVVPLPGIPVILAPASVTAGDAGLTARVADQANCTFLWTITNGTITAGQGTGEIAFTATNVGPMSLSCLARNAASDGSSSELANVEVVAIPTIQVSPSDSAIRLGRGEQKPFVAQVRGLANSQIIWSVLPAGAGSVSDKGIYQAPASPVAVPGPYRVRAVSVAEPAIFGEAVFDLEPSASLALKASTPVKVRAVFVGEENAIPFDVSSSDSAVSVASIQYQSFSGSGAAPTYDATRKLVLWSPSSMDKGLKTLILSAVASNGTTTSFQFQAEVLEWSRLFSGACGNEGGVFADPSGEYMVSVPADSLQGGFTQVSVALDVARRESGKLITRPLVQGAVDGADIRVVIPEEVKPAAANVAMNRVNEKVGTEPAKRSTAGAKRDLQSAGIASVQTMAAYSTSDDPLADNWQDGKLRVRTFWGRQWTDLTLSHERILWPDQYFAYQSPYATEKGDRSLADEMAYLYGEATSADALQKLRQALYADPSQAPPVQPILFIHGYNPELMGEGGGGEGTWGQAMKMAKELGRIHGLMTVCYEFRWETSSRFEEQAYHLSLAIKDIVNITKKKPILVGHSFGGVLAMIYLAGLAENVNAKPPIARKVAYGDDVFHLVTVGSPLAGIHTTGVAGLKTNVDPIDYFLVRGEDPDDSSMRLGQQWTMFSLGAPSPFERSFTGLSPTDSIQTEALRKLGFYLEPMGHTRGRLHEVFKRDPNFKLPAPTTLMVAQRSEHVVASGDLSSSKRRSGDGLIDLQGQCLLYSDYTDLFASVWPAGLFNKSIVDHNYRYFRMHTDNYYESVSIPSSEAGIKTFGFIHTFAQGGVTSKPWINFQGQILESKPGDPVDAYLGSAFARNAQEVYIRSPKGQTGFLYVPDYSKWPRTPEAWGSVVSQLQVFPHPLRIVMNDVLEKAKGNPELIQPTAKLTTHLGTVFGGGSQPYVLRVLDPNLAPPANQLDRREGRTASDGTFSFISEDFSSDPTRLRFELTLGDNATHETVKISRPWSTEVNYGTQTVAKRELGTGRVSFQGLVQAEDGSPLSGALVQIWRGDFIPYEIPSMLSLPTTDSTRQMTSSVDGLVSSAGLGLLSGAYTARVLTGTGLNQAVKGNFLFNLPSSDPVVMRLSSPGAASVFINPGSATLALGKTITFRATVSSQVGGVDPSVRWRVVSGDGSIDPVSGLFTAPVTPGTCQVEAYLAANFNVVSLRATITIQTAALSFALASDARIELVSIPAGSFMMGTPDHEVAGVNGEKPQHPVTLSPFYMAKFETTQAQWVALMGGNPSQFTGDMNLPVERLSWNDIAQAGGFLDRLNATTQGVRPAGMIFRLPTEAEWEYACRAGTQTRFYWGEDPTLSEIGNYAWHEGNGPTHPVGQKIPNAFGLYDMSGNVWEWCQDWYGPYAAAPQMDPAGPATGIFNIVRGGSWGNDNYCRSANRWSYMGDIQLSGSFGFRVVLAAPRTPAGLNHILPGGVSLDLAAIPGGSFLMGSPDTEQDRDPNEGPQHNVMLSAFCMAKVETTQAQWQAVMGSNPSGYTGDLNLPVETVSWNDITQTNGFLERLNAITATTRPAGMVFRLPTEAEWEYAARAGTTTRFYWGDDPSYTAGNDFTWWGPNFTGMTHPVGLKLPNNFGLYDMAGNVYEWCQDWYGAYGSASAMDPAGPATGAQRVIRDGFYGVSGNACRMANRFWSPLVGPAYADKGLGFRVVLASPRTP